MVFLKALVRFFDRERIYLILICIQTHILLLFLGVDDLKTSVNNYTHKNKGSAMQARRWKLTSLSFMFDFNFKILFIELVFCPVLQKALKDKEATKQ